MTSPTCTSGMSVYIKQAIFGIPRRHERSGSFIGTGKKEQAPKIKRRDSAQRTRPADESHIGPPAAS